VDDEATLEQEEQAGGRTAAETAAEIDALKVSIVSLSPVL
jgi:hypothetical protein